MLTLAAAAGGGAGHAGEPPPVRAVPPEASRFGLDYVFLSMPQYRRDAWVDALAESRAGWLNVAEVSWAALEPRPPRDGRHAYDWDVLDALVAAWQKRGLRLTFSLRLKHGWFAGPVRYRPDATIPLGELWLRNSDRLPAAEHRPAYGAWIRALVERYDGDGTDDLPGLREPVLHYQLGNEYSNPMFWTGTLEDYAELLEDTRQAAREACAQVRIISNGIRWNDLFHRDPQAEKLEERFDAFLRRLPTDGWRDGVRRARAITEGTVALAGRYDILDAGGNGGYPTMSAGYMVWVRRELAKARQAPPIWDMEARCEPMIARDPGLYHDELLVPGGTEVLRALREPGHRRHAEAAAWYRAEQARLLVKVFVTRFAAGFEKVFMGMASDWDGTLGALAAPNPYLGLLDSSGRPQAARDAMAWLAAAVDGFDRAGPAPAPDGVELYRFSFPGGRPDVWVAWLAESRTRGWDDPLSARTVELKPVRWPVSAERAPTALGAGERVELRRAAQGVALELTPTPVAIR